MYAGQDKRGPLSVISKSMTSFCSSIFSSALLKNTLSCTGGYVVGTERKLHSLILYHHFLRPPFHVQRDIQYQFGQIFYPSHLKIIQVPYGDLANGEVVGEFHSIMLPVLFGN